MLKKQRFQHPIYGIIEIVPNTRARRLIMRARPDAIYITVPPTATGKDIEHALEVYGNRLVEDKSRLEEKIIGPHYCIEAPLYNFTIELHEKESFILKERNGCFTLLCPTTTDLATPARQKWIKKVIAESMRKRAKETLPLRLAELAAKHGLHYNCVSIRDCHTRWGSCNSKGNITLSIYLMMLPCELIDYVLLHELCHTLEMNHSSHFWERLSNLLGKDAKTTREGLRNYRPGV